MVVVLRKPQWQGFGDEPKVFKVTRLCRPMCGSGYALPLQLYFFELGLRPEA
jgi:hypothetical protein